MSHQRITIERVFNTFSSAILLFLLIGNSSCSGQLKTKTTDNVVAIDNSKLVGGGCDGCELMFVGMPCNIDEVDTSSGWTESGQKLLVTGTVYQIDGKTPAPNVLLYYWHTNSEGYYTSKVTLPDKARKHGHLRGWVKTDNAGNYAIYTIRPAPYPDREIPAHIHIAVKEPEIKDEYYIDDVVFDDDPLLTSSERIKLKNRAGSGIVRVLINGNIQVAEHSIVLGLNIPNYPMKNGQKLDSGLEIGEEQPSFTPFHAFGPDIGTTTCPVCKYGRFHGIIYFANDHSNWSEIRQWLTYLEKESVERGDYLKVYFVYSSNNSLNHRELQRMLEKEGEELQIQNTALTFVPSFTDNKSEVHLNKISTKVQNTIIVYKHRIVIDKYVDLKPSETSFKRISKVLDKTKNAYFNLPEMKHD